MCRLLPRIAALTVLAFSAPALAQQPPTSTGPAPQTPPASGAPQSPLVVKTVKLDTGWRASKLIGASVYNDQNNTIGTVDDLIVGDDDKLLMMVVSVGGFLGIGSKLVAIPYEQVHFDQNRKATIPGVTKDSLSAMPNFSYGG